MNPKKTFLLVLVSLFILSGCTVAQSQKPVAQMPEPVMQTPEPVTQTVQTEPTQIKTQALNVNPITLEDAGNDKKSDCKNSLDGCPVAQVLKTETNPLNQQSVEIFLVALEDAGNNGQAIGCGDSVVPVTRTIPLTTNLIEGALSDLLSLEGQYYEKSGLYNALYQSNLEVSEVSISKGTASVYLTGKYMLGGMCDTPRFEAQLRETILQFPEIQEAVIFINGTEIGELLSER